MNAILNASVLYQIADTDAQYTMVRFLFRNTPWLLVRLTFALLLVSAFAHGQEGRQQIADLGTCSLESGQVILDCRVGYRTFGRLNERRSNAVLMPTWLNGRSEDLVSLFGKDALAPHLVDTTKLFGIALDAFGDGVSSSPSNSVRQPGPEFPRFSIDDMVRAQYRVLTEVLHVAHAHAAVGLSMGGHQVFAWTVLYPHFVDLAVPIVGSPQVTLYDLLSKQVVLDAIELDPAYHNGFYKEQPALKLANAIGALIVTAPAFRNAGTSREDFSGWLSTIEAPQRQDANDRVSQLRAILSQDVLRGQPLDVVARNTSAKFLVVVATQDRMVVPEPALAWARALTAPTYVSPGSCAHLIMNCDAANVTLRVSAFLEGRPLPAP